MVANVNNKISTVELDKIKNDLTVYFANLGKEYFYQFRYGKQFCLDKMQMYKELLMYQWVLTYWYQYEDGTPVPDVNKISLSDFNIMVARIKFLIA